MNKIIIKDMKFNQLTYRQKERKLKDLSYNIYHIGAHEIDGKFLHIGLKKCANTNNVKAILRKHFGIKMIVKEGCDSKFNIVKYNHVSIDDIYKLCRVFLEFNTVDVSYVNRFDPLGKTDTIKKRIYQYGKVRYDLLNV